MTDHHEDEGGRESFFRRLDADVRSGRRSMRDLTTRETDELLGYLSGVPTRVAHRRRLGVPLLTTVSAVVLVPWIIVLATRLPRHYDVTHWAAAWVGFDVAEAVVLAVTAYLGWRGRAAVAYTALVAAVMLICDAWFDIMTANRSGIWFSVADAALIELPFAFLLLRGSFHLLRVTASHLKVNDGQRMTVREMWRAPVLPPAPRRSDRPSSAAVPAQAGTGDGPADLHQQP